MSSEISGAYDNLIALRPPAGAADLERARAAAGQVRRQLSLLQGYADLMEGLSPQQNIRILRVMAEKIKELTQALRPYVEEAAEQRALTPVETWRARSRNRELMKKYRLLLDPLRQSVDEAQASLPPTT